jgi:Tfp pilus assembly protein PilF
LQHYTPAAPAVRETLERLLASETFGRSERARELLRYLVERQQAGDGDRLKGFAIAVDVFGRDTDFDSATDAVVRVQAGRLRELLNQYFTTEGASDPFRITIPRGSYVPTYEANALPLPAASDPAENAASDTATPAIAAPAPRHRAGLVPLPSMMHHLRFLWAAIALVIVMLGVLIFRQGSFLPSSGGEVASVETAVATSSIAAAPVLEALPKVYIGVKTKGGGAERVAASLRAGLSGFDTIDFIGRDTSASPDSIADASSFVFQILPEPTGGGITLELQNLASGRVLLSRNLRAADTDPSKVEDRISGILTATVPATGTIYNYIEQNDLQEGLTQCLLLDDKYYLDQNADTHKSAYRCLEQLVRQNVKSPLVYSEIASLHLEAVTKRYPYPAGATADQAIAFARHAIQMGSTSASVHRSYGYLNSRLGKSETAIRWMRKAYELNTYDLGMGAAYGYGLIFAGRYAEGTPILARAVEASSAHPTWWDFGLFVGEFMLGRMDEAKRASDALTTTLPKSHYLAARIISARTTGDQAQAKQLITTLTSEFPQFVSDPRKVFLERNYPADLTDRLVKALREAGLPDAS